MCGIVGIINHKKSYLNGAERLFRDMLVMNQVRGTDGTGMFWSRGKKEFGWTKLHGNAMEFLEDKNAIEALHTTENYYFTVGHNRAATSGGISIETTQPVEDGHICLVHNGTLSSWPTKWKDSFYNFHKGREDTMDTKGIAHVLEHKDIRFVNEHCVGAMSLVWYDDRDQSLNFFRNRDRPMWFAPTERCILFGSEPGLLSWAAARNDFVRGKDDYIVPSKPFTHYKYLKGESKPRVWDIPEKTYFPPSSTYHGGRGASSSSSGGDTSHSPEQEDDTSATSTPVKGTGNVVPLFNKKNIKIKQKNIEKFGPYKVGYIATFSLSDVKKKKNPAQKFLEIEGEPMGGKDSDSYMFHANINVDEREIYDNDKYLKGEVAALTQEKSTGFVHIFLKDVAFTQTPDPVWQKPNKPSGVIPGYQGRIGALEKEIADAKKEVPALEKRKEPDLSTALFSCACCKKAVEGKEASVLTFRYKMKNGSNTVRNTSKYICRACIGKWDEHGAAAMMPDDLKSPLIDLIGSHMHSVCAPSPTLQ